MNQDEKIVEQYLLSQGYSQSQIVHEPDGNIPPDFTVDGRLALEVRRLNQQYATNDGLTGLEEDSIPIDHMVEKTLVDLGSSNDGHYWFVSWQIRRPLAKVRIIKQDLLKLLSIVGGANTDNIVTITKKIRSNHPEWYPDNPYWSPDPKSDRIELNLPSGLGVRLSKNTTEMPPDCQKFEPLARMDWDAGGRVIEILGRNIRHCIAEKEIKVEPYLDNYEEWWLILVDHITYDLISDLKSFEQEQLKREIQVNTPWSRIIIVNLLNPADSLSFEYN